MASFYELLAQNIPDVQTKKALILVGLQNELLAPGGRLQVNAAGDYVQRIKDLVIGFRDQGGIVIWVRSVYDPEVNPKLEEIDDYNTVTQTESSEENRDGTDDEELFLNPNSKHFGLCLKGTPSAEFLSEVQPLILPKDIQLVKHQYSAFTSTGLLSMLRSRLVTKLYVGGSLTNISVHATALDAARNGIETVILEDCLAYCSRERHELAIRRLLEYSVARCLTSERALHLLQHPEDDVVSEVEESGDECSDALEVDSDEDEEEMPLPAALPLRMRAQDNRKNTAHGDEPKAHGRPSECLKTEHRAPSSDASTSKASLKSSLKIESSKGDGATPEASARYFNLSSACTKSEGP